MKMAQQFDGRCAQTLFAKIEEDLGLHSKVRFKCNVEILLFSHLTQELHIVLVLQLPYYLLQSKQKFQENNYSCYNFKEILSLPNHASLNCSAKVAPTMFFIPSKSAITAGIQFEVYDMEMKTIVARHKTNYPVIFWKWLSSDVIGMVSELAVYHWHISHGMYSRGVCLTI